MNAELITINQAAERGIVLLRKPVWACAEDHLKIDIIDGKPGPWTHLYAPFNMECNGRDPVDLIFTCMDYDALEWLPHDGPTHDSEAYKQAQSRYSGCLAD